MPAWEETVVGRNVTVVGPVGFDPSGGGVAGMQFYIPFVGSGDKSGRLLWKCEANFPHRAAADKRRLEMLAQPGFYGVDDRETFLAVATLFKQGIEANRPVDTRPN